MKHLLTECQFGIIVGREIFQCEVLVWMTELTDWGFWLNSNTCVIEMSLEMRISTYTLFYLLYAVV